MSQFSSAKKQAADVMKLLQGKNIKSVGTVRNFESRLRVICQHFKDAHAEALVEITPSRAIEYLYDRALEVSQSTLDMERQALEIMMHEVSLLLPKDQKLPVIKSKLLQVLMSRAYTTHQAYMVSCAQKEANSFSTKLMFFGGLRAHELFTIRPIEEQTPSARPSHNLKFLGRENWARYTVVGKGGLIREVRLPLSVANRLEQKRLLEARTIQDRNIYYIQHYDLKGGVNFSNSFSAASKRALGWSTGAHGGRHTFAQERMAMLMLMGVCRELALRIVSQEMGHFRPGITEVYLR